MTEQTGQTGQQPPLTGEPARTEAAALTIDGTGLLCVTLLIRLRAAIHDLPPGSLLHLIATDPAAPLDLPAWCHLTGHTYLGPLDTPANASTYAIRTVNQPRTTQTHRPWVLDSPHPADQKHSAR